MTKKLKILMLSATMLIGSIGLAGCSKKDANVGNDANFTKVVLILDEGGVNDASFNQSAWEGALKAKKEHGNVDVSFIESKSENEYLSNVETAIDQEADLIIGVGFKLASVIDEAAKAYPNQKFAAIDCSYEEIQPNVQPILFNEQQSGYITGLIAGKMTETNVLSFLGGMDVPSCSSFKVGFEKGVKEVNPDATVLCQYANSFSDAAKGKAIAEQMILNNSDIIFSAAGGCNIGAIEAAKENNVKIIGVDMPSNHIAPDTIITSALKRVDVGVQSAIEDVISEQFQGGKVKIFDLSNNGVGYERTDLLPDYIMEYVDAKLNEIK